MKKKPRNGKVGQVAPPAIPSGINRLEWIDPATLAGLEAVKGGRLSLSKPMARLAKCDEIAQLISPSPIPAEGSNRSDVVDVHFARFGLLLAAKATGPIVPHKSGSSLFPPIEPVGRMSPDAGSERRVVVSEDVTSAAFSVAVEVSLLRFAREDKQRRAAMGASNFGLAGCHSLRLALADLRAVRRRVSKAKSFTDDRCSAGIARSFFKLHAVGTAACAAAKHFRESLQPPPMHKKTLAALVARCGYPAAVTVSSPKMPRSPIAGRRRQFLSAAARAFIQHRFCVR